MVYIGIGCMILFTLSKLLRLKKILDKQVKLEEVDEVFLSRIND